MRFTFTITMALISLATFGYASHAVLAPLSIACCDETCLACASDSTTPLESCDNCDGKF